MADSPEDCSEVKNQINEMKKMFFDIWSQPDAKAIADQIRQDHKGPIDSYFDQMDSLWWDDKWYDAGITVGKLSKLYWYYWPSSNSLSSQRSNKDP